MNIAVDKTINANKEWDTAANKKLNTIPKKTVNADQRWDILATK